MRYQGKITNWNDDRGFGFVIPNDGGEKAFVHIKAFTNFSRRPVDGDVITYEIGNDNKERVIAKNIRFPGEPSPNHNSQKISSIGTRFTISFCIFFIFWAVVGLIPLAITLLYLMASTVTVFLYAIDKSAAKNNRWRTQESTLHFFALIGGWPGALLAQKIFRHKSKKKEFQTVFWITVIVNCIGLGWIITTKSGATFLNTILAFIEIKLL